MLGSAALVHEEGAGRRLNGGGDATVREARALSGFDLEHGVAAARVGEACVVARVLGVRKGAQAAPRADRRLAANPRPAPGGERNVAYHEAWSIRPPRRPFLQEVLKREHDLAREELGDKKRGGG